MKRDMDLIRKMLLAVEEAPGGFAPDDLHIDGYTEDQIGYHSYLLVDAGLATGQDVTNTGSSGPEAMLNSLTWAGHDFLAAARNDTVWQKVTSRVTSLAGDVPFAVWKELLTASVRSLFGESPQG